MSGRPRVDVNAELRASQIRDAIAGDVRRLLADSGIKPSALARAAGVSPSMVTRILLAQRDASPETLARPAIALGGDVSVRIVPGAGIAIHDAVQGRMVEALIKEVLEV